MYTPFTTNNTLTLKNQSRTFVDLGLYMKSSAKVVVNMNTQVFNLGV